MPTQIAATPIIRGKEAETIWKEVTQVPAYDTQNAKIKLEEKFSKIIATTGSF